MVSKVIVKQDANECDQLFVTLNADVSDQISVLFMLHLEIMKNFRKPAMSHVRYKYEKNLYNQVGRRILDSEASIK